MNYTNLQQYPLQQTKTYSFVYNNHPYQGQFISKKTKQNIVEFLFHEFVLCVSIHESLNVLFLKESVSVSTDNHFSDSDSDSKSNYSESESISDDDNEYNIIDSDREMDDYIFICS